jgi:two-component system, NtrC family, response regulator HydG
MAGLKILVCEDDFEVADSLSYILKMEGYRVTMTHDGETALQCAANENYDIALLDILLPGMNGVECYIALKKLASVKDIRLMTGYAGNDLIQQAKAEGATDIMYKPLRPLDILARLEAR